MGLLTHWREAGFKKKNRSRRGSTFVEAALILPIAILSVSLIIAYAADKYDKVKAQTEEHNALREASMDGDRIDRGESDFVRNIDFLLEEI